MCSFSGQCAVAPYRPLLHNQLLAHNMHWMRRESDLLTLCRHVTQALPHGHFVCTILHLQQHLDTIDGCCHCATDSTSKPCPTYEACMSASSMVKTSCHSHQGIASAHVSHDHEWHRPCLRTSRKHKLVQTPWVLVRLRLSELCCIHHGHLSGLLLPCCRRAEFSRLLPARQAACGLDVQTGALLNAPDCLALEQCAYRCSLQQPTLLVKVSRVCEVADERWLCNKLGFLLW